MSLVYNNKNEKNSLIPIFLVNFIGSLGYSIVLPFLVILVLEFGGNELIYGILGATYSFFQLIGAPVLGVWSDKIGRRKILLLSQGGTFLAWIIFLIALVVPVSNLISVDNGILGAFVLTIPLLLLFFARALDGITGGNISVANAYLSDVSTDEDRKANFGKMSAAGNLGFIVGPAIAGLLGASILGNILPVLAALFVSLIAVGLIYFQLKEQNNCPEQSGLLEDGEVRKILSQEQKECYVIQGEQNHSINQVLKIKNAPVVLLVYFIVFLGFNFFYVAFPVNAVYNLNWSTIELGIFFSTMSGVMILFQGPVMSRLSKRYKERPLIVFGSFLLAGGFLCFISNNILFITLGTFLFAAGNGIMWPSFLSSMSSMANKQMQGSLQGLASSVGSLASIIGLILGGILFGIMGTLLFIIPATTFIVVTFIVVAKRI
jgi:DHA1 family tetracycline resistance protein-like MFS transporter